MSPKLKRMSGSDAESIFHKFGFETVSQKGSHLKLVRITPSGERQILTIPAHKELDKGTLRAIIRQASAFIPEDELKPHFYSE